MSGVWPTVAFKSKRLSQDTSPAGSSPGPTQLSSPLSAQSLTPSSPWPRPVPESTQSLLLPVLMSYLWVPKQLDVSCFSAFAHVPSSAWNSQPLPTPHPTLSIISTPSVMKTELRHLLRKPSLTTPHPELTASSSGLLYILFKSVLSRVSFFSLFIFTVFIYTNL